MFYNEEQGKRIITFDNYYSYRESIFKMLSSIFPYLYDEEMIVLIKGYINDFLMRNITNAVSTADMKMISPFCEISDSLKLLKETIEFIQNRKSNFDILNTEYLLLSKCKVRYLTKYFETFLPKFLELNSDFNLKLYEVEYGAQWVRNSEMPSYQLEYEKIVKRFRRYMKRANLLDETIIKKLEVFANSYYKLKADFDNGKFSEEEFIEKLEKEYEINHKNLKTPK